MRCPDCNVFVAYDTEVEPEEANELSYDGKTLTGSYTRALNCEQCSTELKTGEIEFEVEIEWTGPPRCGAATDEKHEFEVTAEASPSTGRIDTDRRGEKIKSARYMTTTYGVELSGTIRCAHCGRSQDFAAEASMAASSFDESV